MTEICLHFQCAHYGFYGNARLCHDAWGLTRPIITIACLRFTNTFGARMAEIPPPCPRSIPISRAWPFSLIVHARARAWICIAFSLCRLHTGESVGELFKDPANLFASAPVNQRVSYTDGA